MKKNMTIFLILLFSFCSLSAQDISKELKAQNREVIKLVVKEISKNLPQKVDNYTTFVNISSKDLTLIYTFEIFTGAQSDETVRKEGKKKMEKVVKNGICKSSKRFLESDINISYVYISAVTKKILFRFDMTKSDCIY